MNIEHLSTPSAAIRSTDGTTLGEATTGKSVAIANDIKAAISSNIAANGGSPCK